MAMKNVEDIYPLSPMQQGMLFHSLYAPEEGLYVTQMSCELVGDLDFEAFTQAWEEVIRRHGILRTAFVVEGLDEPLQVVRRKARLRISQEDWRQLGETELEGRWQELLAEDRRRGFDLTKAPLMRFALLRTADDVHRALWTSHHILLDGWCLSVLLEELQILYEARVRGQQVVLDRPRPYRDYIAWLKKQDPEAAQSFWRRRLGGFHEPVPGLLRAAGGPADDEPSREAPPQHAEDAVLLTRQQTEGLLATARRLGLTVNTVVQGAFALLLGRYHDRRDVVQGVVVSGRPAELPGVDDILGLFINTLPLRVTFPDGQEVRPWLQALQGELTQLRQFEYSALTDIQRWSDLPAGESLFENVLAFQNAPGKGDEGGEEVPAGVEPSLRLGDLKSEERINYRLLFAVEPAEEMELTASFTLPPYTGSAVRRILGHFKNLLLGLAEAGRETRLGELRLLSPTERQQILLEWSGGESPYPRDASLAQVFACQAARTPEAPAVMACGEQLTFRELDSRSAELAASLADRGVGVGDRVGLCMERGLPMVVATLAVVRSGAAYVPLDPEYPAERLELMVEDAGVALVLTDPGGSPAPLPPAVAVLPVNGGGEPATRLEGGTGPSLCGDSLAYVMYTSGSTGLPKGIGIPHRAVHRLVRSTDYVRLGEGDRVAQIANVSFDAATFEIWGALLTGATLVILPREVTLDPERLSAALEERGVTSLFLTTALFNQVAREVPEAFAGARELLFGGELVDPAAVRRVLGASPPERLLHVYGPTENTTFSTWYEVPR
ncbi:MAG: AMP-binding protein, partial [Acidobacteria bacterium]|nr:AMP-binding protein [Acidobacteriota bacterium]